MGTGTQPRRGLLKRAFYLAITKFIDGDEKLCAAADSH